MSEWKHIFKGCLLKNPWDREECVDEGISSTVQNEKKNSCQKMRKNDMRWDKRLKAGKKTAAVDKLGNQAGTVINGAEVLCLMFPSDFFPDFEHHQLFVSTLPGMTSQ